MNKLFLLIILIFGIEMSFSQTKIDTLQQNLLTTKNEKLRLIILDTLVKKMMQSNHPDQMKYLKELMNVAKKQEKYDLAAEKSRFIIQNYTNKGQLDSTLHVIENMLALKEKYKKKSSEAHLLLKRGSYYYNKGELNKASMDYDMAGDLFLKSGDSIFTADARFFAGQVYVDSNNFLESVKRFEKAYELYDLLGDKDYSNYTLNELSILYGKNDFNNKAIEERNRILSDAKKIKNNAAIAYAYYHLNTSYTKKNELDIAKKYIDSLANSITKVKDLTKKKNINLSIVYVSYFIKSNSLDSVPKYLNQLDKQLTLSNAPNHQKNLLLYYSAKYYKKRKQYNKA